MALKHHWKFNGNLQDAVGDLHLTNVVGTPAYTSNKDGAANSCVDNSVDWYAYSYNTVELSDPQRSYSFWIENPLDTFSTRIPIYQDKMFHVGKPFSSRSIFLWHRSDIRWTQVGSGLSGSFEGVIGDWIHVCITINNVGVKKMFINGILKGIVTNTIAPVDDISRSSVLINRYRHINDTMFGANPKNIDEFKYFDHILTDGGLTTVGQAASVNSEVWLLYLDGVNNRPRYTLNEATNVTATTATVSWTK